MKQFYLRMALTGLLFTCVFTAFGQNVGINDDNSSPDPNAILDVKSTSKGVLFPRMTTAQRNTLGSANPTEGMLVFDTDAEAFFYFINGNWVELSTGNNNASSVPVGTILPYGGHVVDNNTLTIVADGYLLCNGASINSASGPYVALAEVIDQYWGDNDGMPNTVNLPDLRGMFLRGVNGLRTDNLKDPDAVSRYAMLANGSVGNHAGSVQGDAFQGHAHGPGGNFQSFSGKPGNPQTGAGMAGDQLGSNPNTGEAVSSSFGDINTSIETRPKNAYVHYIIKY